MSTYYANTSAMLALAGSMIRAPLCDVDKALEELGHFAAATKWRAPTGTPAEAMDAALELVIRELRAGGETLDVAIMCERLAARASDHPVLAPLIGEVRSGLAADTVACELWPTVKTATRRVIEHRAERLMRDVSESKYLRPQEKAAKQSKIAALIPSDTDNQKRTKEAFKSAVRANFDPSKPTRIAIPSGVPALDHYIRDGFGVGELTVIALPTNEGKSLIAATLTRNVQWPNAMRPMTSYLARRLIPDVSSTDIYALLVTLEDPTQTVLHRWTCDLLDVETSALDKPERRAGTLADRASLHETITEDLTGPRSRVMLVDADTLTENGSSDQIERVVEYMHEWASLIRMERASRGDTEPRLLVIIDHVQTLTTTPDTNQNRERELTLISQQLALFARHEQVAVVCTAMLNGRAGADAEKVEIRESAAIEQKARLSIKAHSCQSFQRELAEAVAAKIAEITGSEVKTDGLAENKSDSPEVKTIKARFALARACHTWKLHKSNNTGGRDCYVTTRAQWDRTRITRLSDAECKIADELNGDVVGWARQLVAERAADLEKKSRPRSRPKNTGTSRSTGTGSDFEPG